MKNVVITITILFSLLFSVVNFATEVTSTTTSETSTSGASVNGNPTSQQTITHSVTTSTTNPGNDFDGKIVSDVYAKYAKDATLIGTALNVTCKNGVVTLSGSVTAQSQADEAATVAKSVIGVKGVISSIEVTTHPAKPVPTTPNY